MGVLAGHMGDGDVSDVAGIVVGAESAIDIRGFQIAVRFFKAVDRRDVRMVQLGGGTHSHRPSPGRNLSEMVHFMRRHEKDGKVTDRRKMGA